MQKEADENFFLLDACTRTHMHAQEKEKRESYEEEETKTVEEAMNVRILFLHPRSHLCEREREGRD